MEEILVIVLLRVLVLEVKGVADWGDGVMEYWSIGVLEYWSIGVLEYCDDEAVAFCLK